MTQLQIKIYGDVQAVGFRYWAKRKADILKLNGFARNEPDGSLTILLQGSKGNLETFLEMCYDGPTMARVTRVEAEWEETEQKFDAFEVR